MRKNLRKHQLCDFGFQSFTEPFKEPITYGKSIAKLANLLSGGVIVQRLGDLKAGRRSTEETDQPRVGHAHHEGRHAWRFKLGAAISTSDRDY